MGFNKQQQKQNENNIRLLADRLSRAQSNLKENPNDIESWNVIIRDAKCKPIDASRDIFEKLVSQFPNHGKFWKLYIDAEMKAKNYEKVEKLFQRSLVKILNIDLWLCYLNYIKEAKVNQPNFKERLAQAYEFTLEKVGLDYKAAPIWAGQIAFLKNIEAVGSYAENQRIAAIRKVYHRACVTPMLNMEQFWRDYISYEQAINPLIAKKLTDELSKEYMSARRALKEMEAITRGLDRSTPPTPLTGSATELKQIDIWKRYLGWEMKNPLNYDDKGLVVKRVMYAFEQCLLSRLSYYSEFWVDAGLYLQKVSKDADGSARGSAFSGDTTNASKSFLDKTSEIYERANCTFFKTHMFMHFVQADFEESRLDYTKAETIYSKLLEPSLVSDPNNDITLVYIQYMRFSKRINGIKGARTVFKKARDDPRVRHQVYTCAAMMEYYTGKDTNIALKIYELGLKKFADNISYILEYLNFSYSLNDDNNTRVLFERLINLSQEQRHPPLSHEHLSLLWNYFLQFEIQVGDYNNILKVDQRRLTALQQLRKLRRQRRRQDEETTADDENDICSYLVDRYRFRDLLPCSALDRKLLGCENYDDFYVELNSSRTLLPSPNTFFKKSTKISANYDKTAASTFGGDISASKLSNSLTSPVFLTKLMSNLGALKASASPSANVTPATSGPDKDQSTSYTATDIAAALLLLKDDFATSFDETGNTNVGRKNLPDLNQMLPFKPLKMSSNELINQPLSDFAIPGGIVSRPPNFEILLSKLPPANFYNGPFVLIDTLLQTILNAELEKFEKPNQSNFIAAQPISMQVGPTVYNGNNQKILVPQGDTNSPSYHGNNIASSSPLPPPTQSSSFEADSEEFHHTPPINDIYRLRQIKKIR